MQRLRDFPTRGLILLVVVGALAGLVWYGDRLPAENDQSPGGGSAECTNVDPEDDLQLEICASREGGGQ